MNNYEYVTVNENKDLWKIDYDNEVAIYLYDFITLDDLEVNNEEYTDLAEWSIREYLESKGYDVNENDDEEKINFHKEDLEDV